MHDGHGAAMGLVFQADLMPGVGGDPLLAPALDAGEVGFWEIHSHGGQVISPTTPREDPRDLPGRGRVTGRRLAA